MSLLVTAALMYHLQGKEDLRELMRPYVILTNLATLAWFIALQYYRFKDTGRACSGDFLGAEMPANFATVYLHDIGQWHLVYIVLQYILYLTTKLATLMIYNKIAAEFEDKSKRLGGMF